MMRTLFVLSLATIATCSHSFLSFKLEQISAASSVSVELAAITTVSGYSALESAKTSVEMDFLSTQTMLPLTASYAEDSHEVALFGIELDEAALKFASTQTFITGKAKETLVEGYEGVVSILKEAAGVKETAKATTSSSSETTGTAVSTSDSARASTAGASDTPKSGVNASGRILVGVVIIGAMAAVALL
ncbi:hypothetical protein BDD12DRAFT_258298 [Trichophaea hybrida]|nr:hypothetical protein BDD12DRAFT_258298 [Trichophaea hybrida]